MTDPDPSGTLKFVADELQLAENAGQRAWVVGHVLPGKRKNFPTAFSRCCPDFFLVAFVVD